MVCLRALGMSPFALQRYDHTFDSPLLLYEPMVPKTTNGLTLAVLFSTQDPKIQIRLIGPVMGRTKWSWVNLILLLVTPKFLVREFFTCWAILKRITYTHWSFQGISSDVTKIFLKKASVPRYVIIWHSDRRHIKRPSGYGYGYVCGNPGL